MRRINKELLLFSNSPTVLYIKILLLITICFVFQTAGYPQELVSPPAPAEKQDSLSLKLTFDIKLLQLEMIWSRVVSLPEFSEIVELKIFADEAEKEKDYSLAIIYLDEIYSIIANNAIIDNNAIIVNNRIQISNYKPDLIADQLLSQTVFDREILIGMDFSQQEYHLTFSTEDSSYIETINNPFGGIKLRWNRYRLNNYDVELGGMFKYSRDYSQWQLNSQFEKSYLSGFKFQLDQSFDGMKYQRYFPIQYWQSLSDLRIEKKINSYFTVQFEDEFQYRNYAGESETFSTYRRNEFQFLLRGSNFLNSRFLLGYDLDQRRQKAYPLYDFNDQRFNFQHYYNPSWKTSYSSWYQFKQMDYPMFVSDSSFVADYNQHFLSINFKQNVQSRIAVRLFAESYSRDYPENAVYWPDYLYLRTEPGLRIELSEKLTFGVDYLFEFRKFKKNEDQANSWFLNENMVSEGVVLSFDFFDFNNLLVSFNHTFRLNSYPDAPDDLFPGLSLFTDRKQNSTMLFVSYQIISGLEINLILQHDLDKDQEISNNDSRSSIFTLDFAWKL